MDLLVVALPLVLLYLRTVSRDLGTIDSGELATVCARLGIAHPTGYPLYTLLGRLAVLAWPGPPIVAVNLLSALLAAAGALAMAALAREVLSGLTPVQTRTPAGVRVPAGRTSGSSVADPRNAGDTGEDLPWVPWAAGLWLGTDAVFWGQANGNEVYGLHILFVALLLRQGMRLLRPGAGPRDLMLTAWVLGLAFANHLSSSFLLPALATAFGFYLARPGATRVGGPAALKMVLAAAGLTLLAWSAVLYLPIRSASQPVLDWGAPTTWHRFWRHSLAAQYRVWFFESGEQWIRNLTDYLGSLPGRLSWPVLLLVPPGAWRLARQSARHLLVTGLVLVMTLVWASSYDIHDLASYFLPADLALVLLAALGAGGLASLLGRRGARPQSVRRLAHLAGAGALLLGLLQGALHLRAEDRREDHFIRTHAEMLLRALPPKTVLLSSHWDALVSPSLYLQEVEGLRRDVAVVDTELLRRSWYLPQLDRWDPTLLAPMKDRVAALQEQLALFEWGLPYDPTTIEGRYRDLIEGIARLHRPERPTAFTQEVEPSFLGSAAPIPEGLVFLLREDPRDAPGLEPPDLDRLLRSGYRPEDPIHRQVLEVWARMVSTRIRFLEIQGRAGEAGPWREVLGRLASVLGPPAAAP